MIEKPHIQTYPDATKTKTSYTNCITSISSILLGLAKTTRDCLRVLQAASRSQHNPVVVPMGCVFGGEPAWDRKTGRIPPKITQTLPLRVEDGRLDYTGNWVFSGSMLKHQRATPAKMEGQDKHAYTKGKDPCNMISHWIIMHT
jgi:hypothetical protein